MPGKIRRNNIERYDIDRSPLSQTPTKRDVSVLLGEAVKDLQKLSLPAFKEQYVVRRQEVIGKKKKLRDLVYPSSRLRRIHEIMKFHLNKIRQPEYLFSPRKNRGQRDNAVVHLEQDQYLTLDIKQFYPSTTALMVRKWFETDLGMYPDVARLLTDLLTIDDKVSFGSPLTPVLCTLVHRRMFDEIADLCRLNNLRCSLWVDDLTISGRFVTGEMVIKIRKIIQNGNLRSHKIKMRTGNRPVFITGIGVVGRKLVAPNELNLRLKQYWEEYHIAESDDERDTCGQRLLSTMGTIKHIVGTKSATGRKIADQMNSLRQKRAKMHKVASDTTLVKLKQSRLVLTTADTEAPF